MDVVVLADTHLGKGVATLPAPVLQAIAEAGVVIHAGDVCSTRALHELQAMATVHAVLGNNDGALHGELPEHLVLDLAGVQLAIVHDSGPTAGRSGRMARRFPGAQLVVFGHSHIPLDEAGVGTQRLFNPGSPTQRRAQPQPTFGRLRLLDGRVVSHTIVALDRPTPRRAPSLR